ALGDLHSFPTRRSSDLGIFVPLGRVWVLPDAMKAAIWGANIQAMVIRIVTRIVLRVVTTLNTRHASFSRSLWRNSLKIGMKALRSEEHTSELQSRENLV